MTEEESNLETFKVTTEKVEGFQSKTSIRDFEMVLDEPESHGGTNEGPNPVEAMLATLGGCLEIVTSMVAKEHGHKVTDFEVELAGDLDPRKFAGQADGDIPAGFQCIEANIEKLEGIPEEEIEEILEEVEARCPIADTISRSIEVEINQ